MDPRASAGLVVLAMAWQAATEDTQSTAGSASHDRTTSKEYVKIMNIGVSVMLLGSVAFMMGLFYLTNQSCKKKATDSWKVISETISIFSGVLLFQGINSFVEASFLPKGASELLILVVSFAQLVVWLIFLQVFLAFISGALTKPGPGQYRNKKLDVECFAVLLGHITGFASIHAFATLQAMLPMQPIYKLLVMPANWVSIFLLGWLFDLIREWKCRDDDGEKDEFEELWDTMAEETEDDIIGLTASFLAVQTFRFWLTGNMPNAEGEENSAHVQGYSNTQVACLVGAALAVCALEAVRLIEIHKTWERFTPQLQNVIAMFMAWNLFFGAFWFSGINFPHLHGMLRHVAIALGLTSVCMALIFALDSLEMWIHRVFRRRASVKYGEAHEVDAKQIECFLESCLGALSILIGFSWERAFDVAVDAVAESAQSVPRHVTKLAMAFVLAGVVVPAWRRHILPHIEELEEQLEAEEAEEEEGERRTSVGSVGNCRFTNAKASIRQARRSRRATAPGGLSGLASSTAVAPREAPEASSGRGGLAAASWQTNGSGGSRQANGSGGLQAPLLSDGCQSRRLEEAAARHEARAEKLARLKEEKDAELDGILARLGELEQKAAASRSVKVCADTDELANTDELVSRLFLALDTDGNGLLDQQETEWFARRAGFEGSGEEWARDFKLVCSGADPMGLTLEAFKALATGRWFCSHEDMRRLTLARWRLRRGGTPP